MAAPGIVPRRLWAARGLAWASPPRSVSSRHLSATPRPALVLAHGFAGGEKFPLVPIEYFRDIEDGLHTAGYDDVFVADVPPFGTVKERATKLVTQIHGWPGRRGLRVAVLAHSMGGLDARYAISKLGGEGLVSTLLTVGTPHLGSPIADLLRHGLGWLNRPMGALKHVFSGGYDLTTEACKAFSADVPDHPDVRYFSVAGNRGSMWRTSPELWLSYRYISEQRGPAGGGNDGLVSVGSAAWGIRLPDIDMDHAMQINFPHLGGRFARAPPSSRILDTWCSFADTVTQKGEPGPGHTQG